MPLVLLLCLQLALSLLQKLLRPNQFLLLLPLLLLLEAVVVASTGKRVLQQPQRPNLL